MVNEIKAEYLLTQLYPELDESWVAKHKGTFFRNYSSDMMTIYPDEKLTELSRDGLLQLLPNTFLSEEDELKGQDREARQRQVKQRLHTLEEAFAPIDSIRFQQSVQIERVTQPILEMKMEYILREYFSFDIRNEKNPYILQTASLLPFVNMLRGDIHLVRGLLKVITGLEVDMQIRDYSKDSTALYSMPHVCYSLHVDNMSSEDYMVFLSEIAPFMDFLMEHFLPFDVKTTVAVTGTNEKELILEYNSTLQ